MTFLAIPICAKNQQEAISAIEQACAAGAELLELRLDYLADPTPDIVCKLVAEAKKSNLPVIATCRPIWEGGQYGGSEPQRQAILAAAARAGADYVDIELIALEQNQIRRENVLAGSTAKLIVSNHDFQGKPTDINDRWSRIRRQNPDIGKLVYLANRINDNFAALDLLHENPGAIILTMGEAGQLGRLLAKKLGGFLTFASLTSGAESAPGQITARQMLDTFRWPAVSAATCLYGVIGCPVAHSMSPAIHNAAFAAVHYDGLYVPLLVEDSSEEFDRFLDGLLRRPWLDFHGLSVTIPHKHHALAWLQKHHAAIEPLAEKIGALNTIIFEKGGRLAGYNTDYTGAMNAITEILGLSPGDLRGLPTAVLGAGGVCRALVAGLTDAGAEVTIYNRTVEKAEKLAAEFHCRCDGLENLRPLSARLIVNGTSIGMYPDTNRSPLPAEFLRPDMMVFDTVYNPMNTMLLRQARQTGAKTVDGVSMFVNQAAVQFERFTGQPAPTALMRQVVTNRLRQ